MKRIDTPSRYIDLFGPGKDGFSDVPGSGTQLNALWHNMVQEEVANAIEGAGIQLDSTKYNQLYTAIVALISTQFNPLYTTVTNLNQKVTDNYDEFTGLKTQVNSGAIKTRWYAPMENFTLSSEHCGYALWRENGAPTVSLPASNDLGMPVGGIVTLSSSSTTGDTTIYIGSGATCLITGSSLRGSGSSFIVAPLGSVTILRQSATMYLASGTGLI